MSIQEWAAVLAALLLASLVLFQLLLAAGFPLARAAWRGRYRVLPRLLRLASVAAAGVLLVALWVVLARADLSTPGAGAGWVRAMAWVFGGYFALNTVGNVTSPGRIERAVMTPVSALLAICFFIVCLSSCCGSREGASSGREHADAGRLVMAVGLEVHDRTGDSPFER